MHHNTVAKVLLHNHSQKVEYTTLNCIQFFNYILLPEGFIDVFNNVVINDAKPSDIFCYLVQYDHINFVDYILKSKELNLNGKIIPILFVLIEFYI